MNISTGDTVRATIPIASRGGVTIVHAEEIGVIVDMDFDLNDPLNYQISFTDVTIWVALSEINIIESKEPVMTFDKYQEAAAETVLDSVKGNTAYFALGLAGESGESCEHFKKHLRGDKPLDKEKVAYELGDVLWYLSQLSTCIGYSLEEIASMNINKLAKRHGK